MKQHLRFLLLATLTSVPVVSVVACGTSSLDQITDQDILNTAEGLMREHPFDMTKLSITEMPANDATYADWSAAAKNIINDYYSSLVSSDSSNWEYEPVLVNIRGVEIIRDSNGTIIEEKDSKFVTKYALVQSSVKLTADLSFKNLNSSVGLTVKIVNDTTTPLAKIEAIRDYLKEYLNNLADPIKFNTLFEDGLKSNNAKYDYSKIERDLRTAFFTSTSKDTSPVIDVVGVEFKVKPLPIVDPGPGTELYTLNSSPITPAVPDPDHEGQNLEPAKVNGTLQGLTFELTYNNQAADFGIADLTSQQIKISQNFSDVTNQIAGMLNQGSDGLWFRGASELPGGIMPTRDQDLKSYLGITIQSVIEEPLALDTKIQQKFFDEISKTYPPTKMGSWWSLAAITFPTAESDKFVVEVSDGDEDNEDIISGYFIVSVRFETQFDANSTIQTTIGDIRINLSK